MITNGKRIAVIVVNYNGLIDSIECLDSLKKIKCPDEINIVFVDNASESDEARIIKEKYPYITVIKSNINGGFAAGSNLGIKYAIIEGYEYIMLLNNDTVVAPDMIEYLIQNCNDDAIAVPKMYYHSASEHIWYGGGNINRWTGNAIHFSMNQKDNPNKIEIQKCSFATGCCMMIKRTVFDKIGIFDETYFMYCEDTEFCLRMAKFGIEINYVPTAKLWHKVSKSTGGNNSSFNTYYMTRNRLNYIKQYKDYFKFTAYPFSVFTRYIRMIQEKDSRIKQAFRKGIRDHFNKVIGKVEI